MSYVIRFAALAGRAIKMDQPTVPQNAYLVAYDPEAHDGQGEAEWTLDPDAAMRFDTQIEAQQFWMQVSKTRPTREDGKPNRPLTAFTIWIEAAP